MEDDDLADLLVELAQKADNELFWFSADELGNTRAVARSSYIHPIILATDRDVVQAAWKSSRSSKWLDRSESGLIKLLRDH